LESVSCRSLDKVEETFQSAWVAAAVVSPERFEMKRVAELADHYPHIPVWVVRAFRPEDGRIVAACSRIGVRGVLMDGVDDAVAPQLIAQRSAVRLLNAMLMEAPERLRLEDDLQRKVWSTVLRSADSAIRVTEIAEQLGITREHLSREFAVGGAPNLKRLIDLGKVAVAAHLLANPAYSVSSVATILRFTSASHLARCARRIAGVKPVDLAALGPRGVVGRFVEGRMWSSS